jgi:DNA ligase-1
MLFYLNLFRQLEKLSGEGSQKQKQEILKTNLDEKLSYLLDVCFNPFVTTKLHKINFLPEITGSHEDLWRDFVSLVEELKKSPAANDQLRSRAEILVSHKLSDDQVEDKDLREIFRKILTKRMNIGIGAKLINKAIGTSLIPDPSPMLATDDQAVIQKWDSICCEEKYDGVRIICLVENNSTKFFTRAFNELDSKYFSKISEEILLLSAGRENIFFDGELTDFDRKSVSGKVTQIMKGSPAESIGDDLLFNIFDMESSSSLTKERGTTVYTERRKNLEFIFADHDLKNLKIAQKWEANKLEDLMPIYDKIVLDGGEGVIMKDPNHVYECKRSKSWIKFKEVQDCDLVITGWYPGEGKREGFIGGFMLTDSSNTLHVKVGAGFTDEDLKILSADADSQIGKIASIQYNVPITDKNGNRSLFLPRFIEIRSDKNQPDDFSKKF